MGEGTQMKEDATPLVECLESWKPHFAKKGASPYMVGVLDEIIKGNPSSLQPAIDECMANRVKHRDELANGGYYWSMYENLVMIDRFFQKGLDADAAFALVPE